MSRVLEVDPAHLDEAEDALTAAVEALARGLLIVVPTETVYGIACRPDRPVATDRLFAAKQRPRDLNLPVLADATETAWECAEPNPAARKLARAFWPGPLTLVLPRTERSRPWLLGEAADTMAVRVPDHALCLALLRRTGPMAATSANLSGRTQLSDREQLVATFGDSVAVYLVLASSVAQPAGAASTVLDLTGEDPRLTRQGPVTMAAVARLLANQPE